MIPSKITVDGARLDGLYLAPFMPKRGDFFSVDGLEGVFIMSGISISAEGTDTEWTTMEQGLTLTRWGGAAGAEGFYLVRCRE